MKASTLLGLGVGVALAVWLLSRYGFASILGLVAHAGWRLVPAILFHVIQLVASALGWRAVMDLLPSARGGRGARVLSMVDFLLLRWIREGVNNLLPVAQIGGQVVSARLMVRHGVPLAEAVAGTVGDITAEVVTQIAFALFGIVLLFQLTGDGGVARALTTGVLTAALVACGLVAAQTLGGGRLVEGFLSRLAGTFGWRSVGIAGLNEALRALYRAPRRLWETLFWHAMSWVLGGGEIWLFMQVLGHGIGFGPALVIESLSQAVKSAGFAVPGAVGVQEGGFVLVCGLFGIAPETAIALSLTKRLREVVLSAPSLLVWQRMERRVIRRQAAV